MSFQPSGYVAWCSTGATNVVEPTDAKKAVGWSVNERPASSYFNWLAQRQDAAISYLLWRNGLDEVLNDAFSYYPAVAIGADLMNQAPTALAPNWLLSPSSVSLGGQVGAEQGIYLAPIGASYLAYAKSFVDVPQRDFRFEVVGYGIAQNASGYVEIGWPRALSFMATGASSFWGLCYRPSGRAATSIGMSFISSGTYPITRMAVEAKGATMVVEVNGVNIYTFPYLTIGQTNSTNSTYEFHVKAQQVGVDTSTLHVASVGVWKQRTR